MDKKHEFCESCVNSWLGKTKSCPICRNESTNDVNSCWEILDNDAENKEKYKQYLEKTFKEAIADILRYL